MVHLIVIKVIFNITHKNTIKRSLESGKFAKCSNRQVCSLKKKRDANSDAAGINLYL